MKKYLTILTVIISFLVILALTVLDLFLHDFHTVIPGQVYRSRQLSPAQFQQVIDEYHIKSILNLRGANPGVSWYTPELQISKQLHVQHYDLALNSEQLPDPAQFRKLVLILENAPGPILIHCESGVDRSGLASVISLILADASLKEASKEISWSYFVFNPASTGKQFMRKYRAWLSEKNIPSSRQTFLQWLAQYD